MCAVSHSLHSHNHWQPCGAGLYNLGNPLFQQDCLPCPDGLVCVSHESLQIVNNMWTFPVAQYAAAPTMSQALVQTYMCPFEFCERSSASVPYLTVAPCNPQSNRLASSPLCGECLDGEGHWLVGVGVPTQRS